MAQPTIVVLAKGYPPTPGGVEMYSERVALAYAEHGFQVVVLTQTDGKRGWRTGKIEGAPRVWNVGAGPQFLVAAVMLSTAFLIRARHRVVGVHATTWRVGLIAAVAGRRVPRVLTVHGREVNEQSGGLAGLLSRVVRDADLVLCVSSATRDLLKDRVALPAGSSQRRVVALNGLSRTPSPAERAQPSRDQVGLLTLCRLVPRKNVVNVVMALALLRSDLRSRCRLVVAGTGPDAATIASKVREFDLQDQVEMRGYVADEDIPGLYRNADIFLHPHSHDEIEFEGFGIAIADAMAYGSAVICGDVGGPLDFVVDEVTGWLVDGTSPESIASALERALDNPARRLSIADSGRMYALSQLSWNRHVDEAVELFNKK